MVQKRSVSYSGTYDAANSIYFKDLGSAGDWDVPFTTLIAAYITTNDVQFWSSGSEATVTSAGAIRVFKHSNVSRPVTATVVGIGLVA